MGFKESDMAKETFSKQLGVPYDEKKRRTMRQVSVGNEWEAFKW